MRRCGQELVDFQSTLVCRETHLFQLRKPKFVKIFPYIWRYVHKTDYVIKNARMRRAESIAYRRRFFRRETRDISLAIFVKSSSLHHHPSKSCLSQKQCHAKDLRGSEKFVVLRRNAIAADVQQELYLQSEVTRRGRAYVSRAARSGLKSPWESTRMPIKHRHCTRQCVICTVTRRSRLATRVVASSATRFVAFVCLSDERCDLKRHRRIRTPWKVEERVRTSRDGRAQF